MVHCGISLETGRAIIRPAYAISSAHQRRHECPRTVDTHLEQIYSKLGVVNRTAATTIAVNAKNRKL
jgi:hypothetical protein